MDYKNSEKVTLIVGAGITGLTAAFLLSKEGEKCLLLEKEKVVGGLCRSYTMDDIIFDLGPHLFFHNPDFEAEKFMMELLKTEKVIKRRFRFAIYNNGKHWKFPLGFLDLLLYPLKYKKHFLLSIVKTIKRKSNDRISVAQDIIDKGGDSYYEDLFASMLLKKTLLPGNKIHRDWVGRVDRDVKNCNEPFREISSGSLFRKILSLIYQTYYYPIKGFEIISQKLWDGYQDMGGETILDCGSIRFNKSLNTITEVLVKNRIYSVKNVIWTGTVNSLNEVLDSNTRKIKYVKTIIVLLTYKQNKYTNRPYVYVYHPEKGLIFNRVYYPSSIYREQSCSGKEGICLELNYMEELDHLADQDIVQKAISDVEKLGLFKKKDLRCEQVIRLGECLPVYDLDYQQKIAETYKMIHCFDNIYSVGRLGGFFFCMTPPAVSQGIKIARHLLMKK